MSTKYELTTLEKLKAAELLESQKQKQKKNKRKCMDKIYVHNNIMQVDTFGKYIYSIFHMIMSFIAVYLTYRCNGKFEWGPFLVALFFPYIYIIHTLASRGTCGIFEKPVVSA